MIVAEDDQVNEVLVNGVKRRAVAPPSIEIATGSLNAVKNVPINRIEKEINKKKKPRNKARRFPVKLKKSKVWSRLLNTEAGISVAEWISLDKEAAAEVVDGIRYLKESRVKASKVKVGDVIGGRGVANVKSGLITGSNPIINGGVGVSGAAESGANNMDINEVRIEEDASSDQTSEYDSGSNLDDVSLSDTEESMALSVGDEDTDLEFSDIESVYRYPYDLQKMKSGSPLRAPISINGKTVEAVFDTGASVSILGSKIATTLGLVPNGDRIQLIGFDQDHGPSESSVIMDVPVNIGGKIRPEHMAVQVNGNDSDVCLLGAPWFQAYGISLDLQRSQIKVPTSNGMIKVQGRTTHINRNPAVNKRNQEVYHVAVSQKFTNTLEDDLIPTGKEGDFGFDKSQEIVYTAENISEGVIDELKDIVEKYKHCFSEVSGLTCIKGYKAKIRLKPDAVPARNRPFRLGWSDQELVNEYVQEMLDLGIVEPSNGE